MDSIRQNKVGRLIQRDLSEMFQKECKEFTVGAMLSVTAVRVSPDMSYARVYLSIFPSNLTEKVLESLAEKNKSIRFILGKKIGKQTRIIPELKFFVDDSLDYTMNLSIFIARRYLFSKKKQNAINIISIISMVGVAIGTTALIVVLSVFNGIDTLLTEATDSFTPDLTISPAKGKFITTDTTLIDQLARMPEISSCDPVVEENSLVKFGDKLVPVVVKGVDSTYAEHVNILPSIVSGIYSLEKDGKPAVVMGYGIAAALKIRLGTLSPVTFYYPDRKASSASSSALNSQQIYPLGIFSAQQDIDGKYVITGIETARELFGVPGQISKIEIKLKDPNQIESLKEKLSVQIQPTYKVENKYDLNRSFYAMMKSERLAVFLILLFILLIASFNIIGSVSMLIIDKKEDIGIYQALGMTKEKIISIFKLEGNLITGFGALVGLALGTILCLLQEYYGFITLGNGSYIVSAYPVKVIASDILIIMITVIAIGYLASHFPVKYLVNKIVKS